jgi:hypothetical protein
LKNLYGEAGYGKKAAELTVQLKQLIRQYDDQEALRILQNGR